MTTQSDIMHLPGQIFHPVRVTIALVIALFVLGGGFAAPDAAAQNDGQRERALSMTFVDATPQASGAIYKKLREIISGSRDIAFTTPSDFLYAATNYQVSLDDLSDAGARVSKQDQIRQAMRAQNLESVVVYKRKSSTLHLIVIGPRGNELRHFRSPIRSERINDQQALGVLRKLFEVLVPDVRQFRRENPDANTGPTTTGGSANGSDGPTDPVKAEAVQKHKNQHANLQRGLTLAVSPIFGRRALTITTETDFTLGHVTPFFGVGGRVDAVFGLLKADTAAIGGSAFVNYAPFTTSFPGDPTKYRADYFRAGGAIRYMGGVTKSLILFGQLGAEGMNVGIASNRTYVGSTYGALNAGLGLVNRFQDFADLRVYAGAMPTFLTNTNDRSFGDGAVSLGFNADVRFTLRLFDPFRISAFYDLALMNPTHPDPRAYEGAAKGTDSVHMGGISAAYHF